MPVHSLCVCVCVLLQESSIWRMCVATGPAEEVCGPQMADNSVQTEDKDTNVEPGRNGGDLHR